MVKDESHIQPTQGSNPRHGKSVCSIRAKGTGDTVRVSAQSGHRKGGPRHYDRRTEVWRGCTPKVSEFEGCSEPSPIRFVGGGAHLKTDLEGGSVPTF